MTPQGGVRQDATGDGKEAVADAEVPQEEAADTYPGRPDLEHAKSAVLNSLSSASGQQKCSHAIDECLRRASLYDCPK